jgi:hypothetical protein
LFQDDGRVLRSASTAVIVDDGHSRERWLFVTGFHAEAIVAVKIAEGNIPDDGRFETVWIAIGPWQGIRSSEAREHIPGLRVKL